MADLSQRTKDFSIVINFPKDYLNVQIKAFIVKLETFCQNNSKEYYFILHDKDKKDLETGELKTSHIHLLISIEKITRLLTFMKRLSVNLYGNDDYNNLQLFSIDKWANHDLGIQYLIHKNEVDITKHVYDIKEVHASDKEYLKTIINYEIEKKLDVKRIIDLCYQSDNILDVYLEIGLTNSRNYLNLIRDIYGRIHKLPF